jgi:hypothetical protein
MFFTALKADVKPSFRELLLVTIVGHLVFIYKLPSFNQTKQPLAPMVKHR